MVKYFEQGDAVKVIEGKFQYETGLVMSVDEANVTMPVVKIDSSQREISISTNNLKLNNGKDKDDIKLVNKRRKQTHSGPMNTGSLVGGEKSQEVTYRVGDVILFNDSKVHGYII